MINLRELIKFDNWFKNSLSSCWKKFYNEIKDLTQKLWSFHFIKDKSKISFFKKIHHVALNENEFKTVNDLFIDNNSNSSSNNDFMLIALFIYFALLVIVLNATVC